jgi:hypothetical protein
MNTSRCSGRPAETPHLPAPPAWPGLVVLALVLACGGSSHPPASVPPAGAGSPEGSAEAGTVGAGYRYLFRMTSPANDRFAITDRAVYLWFWPDTARVNFRMENRLGTPIKILWDECRFRTTDGLVYPTIHRGITYEMRNRSQSFTQVAGLDRYTDWLAPNFLLESPSAASGGPLPLLFPTDALAMGYRGREFAIDFVLEIDGTPFPYHLVFTVDNVSPPE